MPGTVAPEPGGGSGLIVLLRGARHHRGSITTTRACAQEDPVVSNDIPFEEIANGALILLLLRESPTWEALCGRYAYADPAQIATNTTTMTLLARLYELRELGLIRFEDEETPDGKRPVGEIRETGLWTKIRVAFGGMSLSEVAMLSRHARGMAVTPVFGRPRPPGEKVDVFVLMPFNPGMEGLYTGHVKPLGEELGVAIRRADDIFSPAPFMEKVWNGICAAGLVLADCTQKNPNVFYEIGIAHTVGKKIVLITQAEQDIPSDLKHFEYLIYSPGDEQTAQFIHRLRTFLVSHFGLEPRPAIAPE
jgi:hypothetical protein